MAWATIVSPVQGRVYEQLNYVRLEQVSPNAGAITAEEGYFHPETGRWIRTGQPFDLVEHINDQTGFVWFDKTVLPFSVGAHILAFNGGNFYPPQPLYCAFEVSASVPPNNGTHPPPQVSLAPVVLVASLGALAVFAYFMLKR